MNIAVGRSGFHLAAIAAFFDSVAKSYDSHELRAELVINDTDAKTYFAMLEEMKPAIEREDVTSRPIRLPHEQHFAITFR